MPSMKVEGDSDGDGDMSGGDTERSGGSSRGPDRDSSAEEADEPDSDDSSEMDESECERRRNECLDNLANLERQFSALREQLYSERVKQVEHQLDEVRGGRSEDYLGPLRTMQDNMRIRIEVAGVLKQFRIENIKHKYEAEEQAAHQHFKDSETEADHSASQTPVRKFEVYIDDEDSIPDALPGCSASETGSNTIKDLKRELSSHDLDEGRPPAKKSRNRFHAFGEYVAGKIEALQSSAAQNMVEHLISNILFDAGMGKYDLCFLEDNE